MEVVEVYDEDYDILSLHNMLLHFLSEQHNHKISELEDELKSIEIKFNDPSVILTMGQYKGMKKQIDDINQKLSESSRVELYLSEVSEIIEEYKKLGSIKKVIYFGSSHKSNNSRGNGDYRLMLISKYLRLAKRYCPGIHVTRETKPEYNCPNCNFELDILVNEGSRYCPECHFSQPVMLSNGLKNDIAIIREEPPQDRKNFLETIQYYQGIEIVTFPPGFHDKINECLKQHGKPTEEDVKSNLDDYPISQICPEIIGIRKGTSRNLMFSILQKCDYTKLYRHMNRICHDIWLWKLPVISHLEDRLMKDFDTSQPIYREIAGERSSSMNAQFRLYVQLFKLNIPVTEEYFKIPSTDIIETYNRDTWKQISSRLKWPSPFDSTGRTIRFGPKR